MATNPVNDLNKLVQDAEKAARDGAYVVLGLGILGFQQAQVRRRELAKRLSEPGGLGEQLTAQAQRLGTEMAGLGERLAANAASRREPLDAPRPSPLVGFLRELDERVAPARQELDRQVGELQRNLPPAAKEVVGTVRQAAAAGEARLRHVIGLDDQDR